eukprot:TRINITY_DN803_c4_g1_i1.p2 TRINITY_DN803_c4_g1~~TRINITY_DN803_c4_g1_i1.p2  ORF type:complete len:177 (-),score=45.18 TRINITY_DN803_c4_g1_i1:821-1303(-)
MGHRQAWTLCPQKRAASPPLFALYDTLLKNSKRPRLRASASASAAAGAAGKASAAAMETWSESPTRLQSPRRCSACAGEGGAEQQRQKREHQATPQAAQQQRVPPLPPPAAACEGQQQQQQQPQQQPSPGMLLTQLMADDRAVEFTKRSQERLMSFLLVR